LDTRTNTLCESIGRFVGESMNELEAKLAGTATVKDMGVWKSTQVYCAGEGVSDKGSFWIAKTTTQSRPGSNGDWRLAAKGTR
jgi:hypothetical protein